jgi:hypothetical protein
MPTRRLFFARNGSVPHFEMRGMVSVAHLIYNIEPKPANHGC